MKTVIVILFLAALCLTISCEGATAQVETTWRTINTLYHNDIVFVTSPGVQNAAYTPGIVRFGRELRNPYTNFYGYGPQGTYQYDYEFPFRWYGKKASRKCAGCWNRYGNCYWRRICDTEYWDGSAVLVNCYWVCE